MARPAAGWPGVPDPADPAEPAGAGVPGPPPVPPGDPARRLVAWTAPPDVAVVIPAHDEEVALAATLASLLRQDYPGRVDVVVVANGCRDATADVARSFSMLASGRSLSVRVVERAEPGKPGALNAGDAVASGGIRVYLDADITLSSNALSAVVDALGRDGCHLAAPAIKVADNPSLVARSYGVVWSSTPTVSRHVVGCGFLAVSAEGRRRWDRFPEITADDKFVRTRFAPEEQQVVRSASMTVYLPTSVVDLVRVRTRQCRGSRELVTVFPECAPPDERGRNLAALRQALGRPDLWLHAPVAAAVYVTGSLLARRAPRRAPAWDVARSTGIRAAAPLGAGGPAAGSRAEPEPVAAVP